MDCVCNIFKRVIFFILRLWNSDTPIKWSQTNKQKKELKKKSQILYLHPFGNPIMSFQTFLLYEVKSIFPLWVCDLLWPEDVNRVEQLWPQPDIQLKLSWFCSYSWSPASARLPMWQSSTKCRPHGTEPLNYICVVKLCPPFTWSS